MQNIDRNQTDWEMANESLEEPLTDAETLQALNMLKFYDAWTDISKKF